MTGWVFLLFFTTEKGPTNIHELGFFRKEIDCLRAKTELLKENQDKSDYFEKKGSVLQYGMEPFCFRAERNK